MVTVQSDQRCGIDGQGELTVIVALSHRDYDAVQTDEGDSRL